MKMKLITQFVHNTLHLFDTSEENVLIIEQARHFLVQRIVSKQTNATVPNQLRYLSSIDMYFVE